MAHITLSHAVVEKRLQPTQSRQTGNRVSSQPTRAHAVRIGAIALTCLLCVACSDDKDDKTSTGGGGSTPTPPASSSSSSGSGSGSGSGSTTPVPDSVFAGSYNGTVFLTASSGTLGSTSDSFAMTAVVNQAGVMTFRSEQFSFTVKVADNGRFSKAVAFDETRNGISCEGTLNVSGRITSGSGAIDGNVDGPVRCERGLLKVSGTATGNFNGRKQ